MVLTEMRKAVRGDELTLEAKYIILIIKAGGSPINGSNMCDLPMIN